jgi:hypothetical protein
MARPSRLTRGSSDANGDADHPARACVRCQTDDAGLRPSRPGDHGPARPMRARFAQRIDGGAPQLSISRERTIWLTPLAASTLWDTGTVARSVVPRHRVDST